MMTASDFHEQAKDFIETQLAVWPEAKARFDDLGKTERKPFRSGRLNGAIQFNPARSRSTTADVSGEAIRKRPCFLCSANRPEEQIAVPIAEGWTMLLNPFPILPVHFTIVSDSHRDQMPDLPQMIAFAEKMPGMAVFFNGAKAGASAPDHLHFQAVVADELPLLREIESAFPSNKPCFVNVEKGEAESDTDAWPFIFSTAVVLPGKEGMKALSSIMDETERGDKELVNLYAWIGKGGELRILRIPRRAHRPSCYSSGEKRLLVSPGAIDMAGLIITVRPEDFESAGNRIQEIYSEVAFTDNNN